MLTRFTPPARAALIRAALAALDTGATGLGTAALLLALAERPDVAPALARHDITPPRIRAALPTLPVTPPPGRAASALGRGPEPAPTARFEDRDLLAALGIDLDEVRRRAGLDREDPAGWSLSRSRRHPLRVTLAGPGGVVAFTGHGRKVLEVAAWSAGRRRPIGGDHLLRGLLSDSHNTASRLLRHLGITPAALCQDLCR